MEEELISFETAKLAKEKGFNIAVSKYFLSDGSLKVNFEDSDGNEREYYFDADSFRENRNKKDWVISEDGYECFGCKYDGKKYFYSYSAPTQSLLQRWLREVHNIHISMLHFWDFENDTESYKANISQINNEVLHTDFHDSYELALEEGLKKALNLIP